MPSPNYVNATVSFDGVQLDPSETPAQVRRVVYEGLQALRVLTQEPELQDLINLMSEGDFEAVEVAWSNGRAFATKAQLQALLDVIQKLRENGGHFEAWRAKGGGRPAKSLDDIKAKVAKAKAQKA